MKSSQIFKIWYSIIEMQVEYVYAQIINFLFTQIIQYIRCIKPNSQQKPAILDDAFVAKQLKSSSVLSYVKYMKNGFPTRIAISALYRTYHPHIGYLRDNYKDERTFCKSLLCSLNLTSDDFKFGQNLLFFRASSAIPFDQLLKPDQKFIQKTIENLKKWMVLFKWRVLIKCMIFLKRL